MRQKYRKKKRQNKEELFELVDSIFRDERKDATRTMSEKKESTTAKQLLKNIM